VTARDWTKTAAWLPHERCGRALPDCTCGHAVDEAVWEVLLERSRSKRLSNKHAAEYERLHQRWAA